MPPVTADQELTIGRLARLSGVGVETVRFYEREGLLARPRRPARGYRAYPAAYVERIRFIRGAQALGFSLREIAELLALQEEREAPCAGVRDRALAKVTAIEAKIADLTRLRDELVRLAAACDGARAARECAILGALAGGAAPAPTAAPGPERKAGSWEAAKRPAARVRRRASAASSRA